MAMTRARARDILGVSSTAGTDEIKKAYRRLASKYHPDRYPDAEKSAMEAKFKEIKSAFEFLESGKDDPYTETRGERANFWRKPWDEEINNRYYEFFNEKKKPGWWDTTFDATIKVTLEEAFQGCSKKINISVLNTIETVEINAGLVPGTRLRSVVGKNVHSGEEIDVRIKLDIELPPKTQVVWAEEVWLYGGAKEGSGNITQLFPVNWLTIMTGGFVEVDTVDGGKVSVRIPAGIEAGSLLRIAGRGYWSDAKKSRRGDLLLRVMPVIPKIDDIQLQDLKLFTQLLDEKFNASN